MSEKNLFPTIEVPDFVEEQETNEDKYRRSVFWDVKRGDFVLDGAHRMVESGGRDTYMQWCHKMVYTERFELLAYPDYVGTELMDAMAQPDNQAVESSLERTITEALLINPLTDYVRDFEYSWSGGDTVYCTFTVKGKDWEEFQIAAKFNQKEVRDYDT